MRQKPHPALLKKWRLQLAAVSWIMPFVFGVMFRPFDVRWVMFSILWFILFMFVYMWYLPCGYRRMSFCIEDGRICFTSGVFIEKNLHIPLGNIQFITRTKYPSDLPFKICSLVLTAPGGKLVLPGLSEEIAKTLEAIITEENSRAPDNHSG